MVARLYWGADMMREVQGSAWMRRGVMGLARLFFWWGGHGGAGGSRNNVGEHQQSQSRLNLDSLIFLCIRQRYSPVGVYAAWVEVPQNNEATMTVAVKTMTREGCAIVAGSSRGWLETKR